MKHNASTNKSKLVEHSPPLQKYNLILKHEQWKKNYFNMISI